MKACSQEKDAMTNKTKNQMNKSEMIKARGGVAQLRDRDGVANANLPDTFRPEADGLVNYQNQLKGPAGGTGFVAGENQWHD